MYPVLHEAGFASQAASTSREDGMRLHDLWISAAVRCAPPGNKPLPEEIANCSSYLDEELALLERLRVVVCLGRIAFDAYLGHLVRVGRIERRSTYLFAHGAEYQITGDRWVIASYHPSLQNTNTGRLTRPMFAKIFARARALAEAE
jgi:uracil-DNA glycosylase